MGWGRFALQRRIERFKVTKRVATSNEGGAADGQAIVLYGIHDPQACVRVILGQEYDLYRLISLGRLVQAEEPLDE